MHLDIIPNCIYVGKKWMKFCFHYQHCSSTNAKITKRPILACLGFLQLQSTLNFKLPIGDGGWLNGQLGAFSLPTITTPVAYYSKLLNLLELLPYRSSFFHLLISFGYTIFPIFAEYIGIEYIGVHSEMSSARDY